MWFTVHGKVPMASNDGRETMWNTIHQFSAEVLAMLRPFSDCLLQPFLHSAFPSRHVCFENCTNILHWIQVWRLGMAGGVGK